MSAPGTNSIVATVLWRRLDAPGHDACRLEQRGGGRTLDGAAVFSQNGMPARLTYRVACDSAWRTERGEVRGWVGDQAVEFQVVRTSDGVWTLNGEVVPDLQACLDLDLGFTPATNLLQLRRIGLAEGQAADVPVAWLDVPAGTLDLLAQRYERRSVTTYWYEARRFDYAALLEVDPAGFIQRYPGLWQAEPGGDGGVLESGVTGPRGETMDDDLEKLGREELVAEVKRLRAGIRTHRDSTGQDLCWHHPDLWNLLPEKIEPDVAVPPWPRFLRGCLRYRESLERELPNAPVADVEFEGRGKGNPR